MTKRIEELWSELRVAAAGAQRRIDAAHPLDLYADFEQPDRPALVLFTRSRPPDASSLKAISIERRQRADGRWSLRICLEEPRLLSVFTELCRDIIVFTRTGVDPERAGGPVLSRIERWRTLMQAHSSALSRSEIRGLIGELLVLDTRLLPELGGERAVHAWKGPFGSDQDFHLPSGLRIEVKALDRDADRVRINGLRQLDAGGDKLQLAAVRLEDTGDQAVDAFTAASLIAKLRAALAEAPAAATEFETLLRFAGWQDAGENERVVVRLVRIDFHDVGPEFPRLTPEGVPRGVLDASYIVLLPTLGDPR
jgi:hypothetical protein